MPSASKSSAEFTANSISEPVAIITRSSFSASISTYPPLEIKPLSFLLWGGKFCRDNIKAVGISFDSKACFQAKAVSTPSHGLQV